jgi:PEP-CTERM motif
MSVLRHMIVAAAMLGLVPAAQAAVVLDQDALYIAQAPRPGVFLANLVSSAGNRTVPQPGVSFNDRRFVQTVTAGATGLLSAVSMQFVRSSAFSGGANGIVQFSLIDGDFGAGARTIVGTFGIPPGAFLNFLDPTGLLTVDTTLLGYQVTPGQRFSIMGQLVSNQPNALFLAVMGQAQFNPQNPSVPPSAYFSTNYAGGSVYSFTGYPAGLVGPASPFDVGFQTFVDTAAAAVPEPTSWALMIAGFGFVGGAMRRRGAKLARV